MPLRSSGGGRSTGVSLVSIGREVTRRRRSRDHRPPPRGPPRRSAHRPGIPAPRLARLQQVVEARSSPLAGQPILSTCGVLPAALFLIRFTWMLTRPRDAEPRASPDEAVFFARARRERELSPQLSEPRDVRRSRRSLSPCFADPVTRRSLLRPRRVSRGAPPLNSDRVAESRGDIAGITRLAVRRSARFRGAVQIDGACSGFARANCANQARSSRQGSPLPPWPSVLYGSHERAAVGPAITVLSP